MSIQFYLIKDLNKEKPFGPRGRRDYSDFPPEAQRGMWWHYWFMDFYEKYADWIREERSPPKAKKPEEQRIINLFYKMENQRYLLNPENWLPVRTEWYLENEYYRGQIDRVDQLDEEGNCRIVEYKAKRKDLDEQEALFYTKLLTDELPIIDKTITLRKVTEIAVYYYETGEFWQKQITRKDVENLEQLLERMREEIFQPNIVKRKNCSPGEIRCKYREICERIFV